MDKQVYRDLLPLVNDKDYYDRLQAFVAAQIEMYRSRLENEKDPLLIRECQGALYELRKMQKLREAVIANAEKK
jgi:hypothetical protein